MALEATLHRFKTDVRLLAPLLFVNILGMAFGWYYYWDVGQFDPSSAYYESPAWWLLVADSPNAVALFFAATLVHRLTGWRSKWLDAAAFILNIYVGVWTTFLFLAYSDAMGTFDWGRVPQGNVNPVLFVAHMGMPLQAFVLLQDMRRDEWGPAARVAVVAAASAYIFVDYWGPMLHPAPFLHPDDLLLHLGSPLLMFVSVAAWLAVTWSAKGQSGPRPARA